ncbi:S66 peptidase family protein [Flavobacterium selenitireducens]|uniref:S66 peptidase family protein n=1 Tax=Flavobacterium selenitireducens TaxID=2722704 RepID=UPI00168C0571|nr:LD-carboxypeptidase [Flavobacterium selenitireducens]MBD3581345.1 LD-carboxypeptidase [Flavobacterium selenitireducens]
MATFVQTYFMKRPAHLKKGDTVYLLNIARKGVYNTEFVTRTFDDWGLRTIVGETISDGGFCQFSASSEVRLRDLQNALDDDRIKAIFFLRGGYGTVQILDKLNFSRFTDHPKWLVGFSDITYLHAHINRNFGIETLHGTMLFGFQTASPADLRSMRKLLFEPTSEFTFGGLENHKIADVKGEIVGGNLSILHTVIGTRSDLETYGKILFIEDTYENLMSIERMLYAMKRSGKFDKLKALLVGDFIIPIKDNETSNCMVAEFPEPDEHTIEKAFRIMLLNFFAEYDFPIVFGLPIGHRPDRNIALNFGRTANLAMTDMELTLEYKI